MTVERIVLYMWSILVFPLALAQEPSSTPCLDNPIRWERRAEAQPTPISEISDEPLIELNAEALIAQLPSEVPTEASCTEPVEKLVHDSRWLVAECALLLNEMTILTFDPAADNSSSLHFALVLLDNRCSVTVSASPTESEQQTYSAFQRLTREEIDSLVADVRGTTLD